MNFSANNHTVYVEPGTYYEHIVISDDLSLISTEGQEVTSIHGGGSDDPVSHSALITINGMSGLIVDEGVLIDGFTLEENHAWNGAAISSSGLGAGADFRNLTIKNNVANNSGGGLGIGQTDFMTTLDNIYITNNTAGSTGGGINAYNVDLILNNVIIDGNRTLNGYPGSPQGGAGLHYEFTNGALDSITISNSTISNNIIEETENGKGGGIFLQGLDYLGLTNVYIVGNHSTWGGGGIYYDTGSLLTMDGCSIDNNRIRFYYLICFFL